MTDPRPAPPPSHARGRGDVRLTTWTRRRWPRRLLVLTNVVVALSLIGAASAFGYVHWRLGQVNSVGVGGLRQDGSSNDPFTLLVVGSDTRALTGTDNAQFGNPVNQTGQRSDTILLVRVVPATRKLSILSIPRDLYEPIVGMGSQRINAAFNSGPTLLVSTIRADLGIPIDHYVEVNFDSFRQITSAVGGVNQYFPTPARDLYSNLVVHQAGCVTLSGDQALSFVRARHYQYYQDGEWHDEAASDLARIERQQAFIRKMIKKAEGQISNPLALNGIIGGVTSNLTVDKGLDTSFLIQLAKIFHSVNASAIPSQTLPTYNLTEAGQEVLGLQQPQGAQMIAAFNSLGQAPVPAATTPATSQPTATVAPSAVSVEVANGSGVSGQAAGAAAALQGLGYPTTVSDAAATGFTSNVIRYAPDSLAAARQLQAELSGGAVLSESSALTSTPYNLELVTGSSYAGVAAAGTSGPTTTPTTASPATAPVPVAPYELPGFLPADAAAAAACT